jgi:hypothetical protein
VGIACTIDACRYTIHIQDDLHRITTCGNNLLRANTTKSTTATTTGTRLAFQIDAVDAQLKVSGMRRTEQQAGGQQTGRKLRQ